MNKEEILGKWLSTFQNKKTQTLYWSGVRQFLLSIYGGEAKKPFEEYEQLAVKYVSECKAGRDWFKDCLDFAVYLSKDNRPPAVTKVYMACTRSFFEFALDAEFSKKQLKTLRGRMPKGKRARTIDGDLSKEKLRKILSHCDIKGNALFLLLESSGIRDGEALELDLDDLDWSSDPVKVTVRGEVAKEGDSYYSFISSEAKEALTQWLNVRTPYLNSSEKKGRGLVKLGNGQGLKDMDDKRLFPFSGSVMNSMWVHAIKNAQLDGRDKSTNRHEFHIHMLRKFFQSSMKYAGVPDDLVEALIGHGDGMDSAYRRYSPIQIADMYEKGEPELLLNVSAQNQIKIKSEMGEQRQELADLTRKMTDSNNLMIRLMAEKDELKAKVERMEKFMDKLLDFNVDDFREMYQDWNRKKFAEQKEADKKQSSS